MSEVKIPTNAKEAAAMALVGMSWLEQNAPEKLTELHREIRAEAGVRGLRHGVALASGGDIPLYSILVKIWSDGYADSIRQEGK